MGNFDDFLKRNNLTLKVPTAPTSPAQNQIVDATKPTGGFDLFLQRNGLTAKPFANINHIAPSGDGIPGIFKPALYPVQSTQPQQPQFRQPVGLIHPLDRISDPIAKQKILDTEALVQQATAMGNQKRLQPLQTEFYQPMQKLQSTLSLYEQKGASSFVTEEGYQSFMNEIDRLRRQADSRKNQYLGDAEMLKEFDKIYKQLNDLSKTAQYHRSNMTASQKVNDGNLAYLQAQEDAAIGKDTTESMWTFYTSLPYRQGFSESSAYQQSSEIPHFVADGEAWDKLDGNQHYALNKALSECSTDKLVYESVNGNWAATVELGKRDLYRDPYTSGLPISMGNSQGMDLTKLSPEETKVFNYLYGKHGWTEAKAFLNTLAGDLSARRLADYTKARAEEAKAQPFLRSVQSIIESPYRSLINTAPVLADALDGKLDPSSAHMADIYTQNAVISTVADGINSEFGKSAYLFGMSLADNVARTAASLGNPFVFSAMAGSKAFASGMSLANAKGIDGWKAIALAGIGAAAEIGAEFIQFDKLFNNPDFSKATIMKYLMGNATTEALEEMTTEGINTLADIIISQDKSDWWKAVQAYKSEGKSDAAAWALAIKDQGSAILEAGKQGFLSGLLMAGGTAGLTYLSGNLPNAPASMPKVQAAVQAEYTKRIEAAKENGTPLSTEAQTSIYQSVVADLAAGKLEGYEMSAADMAKVHNDYQQYLSAHQTAVNSTPTVPHTAGSYSGADIHSAPTPTTAPAENSVLSSAVSTVQQGGTVSNSMAERILSDPRAMETLVKKTGMTPPETMSAQRAAVKAAVAQLANQPAVDTAPQTGYDNQNTPGGAAYGTGEEALPPDPGGTGEITARGRHSASGANGSRPGVSRTASSFGETVVRPDPADSGGRTLTPDEEAAILAYKSGGSYKLNAKLRDDMALDEYDQNLVSNIDTALTKLPSHQGTVYRNLGFDDFGGADARTAFIVEHPLNDIVTYQAFTSTSSDAKGYVVEGSQIVHMEIEGSTGRNMAGYGNNSESEILFPRNTSFLVTGIRYDASGTPTIYLSEVTSDEAADIRGRDSQTHSGDSGGQPIAPAQADSGQVQRLPEQNPGNSQVQAVSQRDPQGNPHEQAGVPGVRGEVTTPSVGAAHSDLASPLPTDVGPAMPHAPGGSKVSKLYSNTYKNATGEAVRGIGQRVQELDPNIARYDPVSEQESLNEAISRANSPEGRSVELNYLLNKNGWTGADNDTAYLILDRLRQEGDAANFAALATKQRRENTTGGQLIRSNAKYTHSVTYCTAEAVKDLFDMTEWDVPKKFYKDKGFGAWRGEVARSILDIANQIETIKDGKVAEMREVIRSLARFRHTTAWLGHSSKLTKVAEKGINTLDFATAKDIALAQLSQITDDFRKRPVGQVIKTIRMHNMLAALTTTNRNIVGNAACGVVDGLSDSTCGRTLDILVSKVTGKRTVGNDIKHAKSYLKSATKATGLAALCAELDIPMNSESRFSTGYTRTFSPQGGVFTKFFGAFEKGMKYALEVTDQFFEGGTTGAVEQSLLDLGEKSGLNAAEVAAISSKAGQRRTFKDDRMLTRGTKWVKKGLNEIGTANHGLGDAAMPLAATGTNVAHTAADYSGAGILEGLFEIARLIKDVKTGAYKDVVKYENGVKYTDKVKEVKNKMTGKTVRTISLVEAQRQAVTNAGRGLTGVGLISAFAFMALKGILQVHDDKDKDERALDQSQNLSGAQFNFSALLRALSGEDVTWQETDWTVSIDFLEPFNAQMYIGYALSQEESVQDAVKAYPGSAASGVVQSILDMPMMQNLSETIKMAEDVGNAVEDGDSTAWSDVAGYLLGSYGTSFIPAWLRQSAHMIDDNYRDTSDDDPLKAAWNQIKSSLPFLSTTLPKKYDGLGNEQLRHNGGVEGLLNTFISPGEVEQIHPNEIVGRLDQISGETGDKAIYPESKAPSGFEYTDKDGKKHAVTITGDNMTETYQKTYGDNVNRLYGDLLDSEAFGKLSPEQQANTLKKAKSYATQLAKASVSDYDEAPAYIRDRPEGMSEAEAIIRHVVTDGKGEKHADLPVDVAAIIAETIGNLPEETKPDGTTHANVRPIQKMEAIVANDELDPYVEMILPAYMEQSQQQKYRQALDKGYDSDEYVAGYRLYLDQDKELSKTRQIQEMAKELDMDFRTAKILWEIYS